MEIKFANTEQQNQTCQRKTPRMKQQQENKMQEFHLISMFCLQSVDSPLANVSVI